MNFVTVMSYQMFKKVMHCVHETKNDIGLWGDKSLSIVPPSGLARCYRVSCEKNSIKEMVTNHINKTYGHYCFSFLEGYGQQRDPTSQGEVWGSHAAAAVLQSLHTFSVFCREWHL